MKSAIYLVPFVAVLALAVGACSDASTDGASSGSSGSSGSDDATPWTQQFLIGNFAINTADVVTNEDGVSASIVSDYVLESALPSADLEQFSIAVYLPSSAAFEPTVTNARVTAGRVDSTRTGNIHRAHERIGIQKIGGKTYTAFRVSASSTATPPLTTASFANVTFELDITYGGEHASTKKIEVYKR